MAKSTAKGGGTGSGLEDGGVGLDPLSEGARWAGRGVFREFLGSGGPDGGADHNGKASPMLQFGDFQFDPEALLL